MAEERDDSQAAGEGETNTTYRIRLKVLDRETGNYRYCTLDEAKRGIGPIRRSGG